MAESDSNYAPISRKAAQGLGLRHYFTGKACKRGHLSHRLVSTCQCCDCLYIGLKTWRRDNRDEARRRDRNWKNKNRDRVRSNYRARYARNPKKFVDKTKRYYKQNSECVRARRIKYHYTIYRDAEVRQRAAARTRRWVKEHPDRVKVNARNGKAKRKNVAGVHTAADIANILTLQKSKCAVCRTSLADKYHIDHIVPVKLGGTNDRANLQILCIACNLQKGARDPIDHMRSLGKLL